MSTLTFAAFHNMVAFLEKPAESDGFHEIIDFLNANQIRYALTVNPTIYTSCIGQFWATAKVKTVNGECQLQALVDKKKVIITETSIRSDLNLEDAGGTDCLPTDTIFEELARMGYEKPFPKLTFYKAFFSPQWKFLIHTITPCLSAKTAAWNKFNSTIAFAIICLATNQKFNMSKYIFDVMTLITTQPSTSKPQKKQSRRKQRKDIKDRMQLHELMNLCTKLSDRVLALETTKTTQALEIASLKSKVKKLKKKASKRTHKFKRLYMGRSIEDIDKDAKVSLVDETHGRSDDTEMFDTDALIRDQVFAEKEHDVIPKEVSTVKILTTVGITIPVGTAEIVSTAEIKTSDAPSTIVVSPPIITESTVTTAPLIIPEAKGITFRDAGETTTRTPTSVSSSSIKDKGKAKMVEPEVPLNKKDQIRLDEELARRLDAEEQEAARLERKNVELQEQATLAKLKNGTMKRHFAKLRAEEKRRKPLTKGQRKNQMCTYLKNIGGFTHNQLKNKSYKEIQKAFDKIMGWINNFKPMDSEEVKSSEKKVEGSRKKSIAKKRAGNEQK
ncbi:hypothetical protein Tco_1328808 [Tanacetum coccineum]